MSKDKISLLGKRMEFDSSQELANYIDANLARAGCESWTIVPAGKAVHILRVHGPDDRCSMSYGVASLAKFKQFVAEELPVGIVDCMSIIVCRDSEQNGALDLFEWLKSKHEEKHFSVMAHGNDRPPLTVEAVRNIQAMVDITSN